MKSGSPRRSAGLRRGEEGQDEGHREGHRHVVVERRGERLDEGAGEGEGAGDTDRARPVGGAGVEGRAGRPGREEGRGGSAEGHEGGEADPALARVPREARPPTAWPTSEAIPSPTARMPQPAAAIHRRSRKSRTRAEHGEGVGEDAHRVAARHVRAAPHPLPAHAGQDLPVEEKGPQGEERGLPPRQPAQEEREGDAADVDDPPGELAPGEAHEALPAGGTSPWARSQRTVSRSPSASGRHS